MNREVYSASALLAQMFSYLVGALVMWTAQGIILLSGLHVVGIRSFNVPDLVIMNKPFTILILIMWCTAIGMVLNIIGSAFFRIILATEKTNITIRQQLVEEHAKADFESISPRE